MRWFNQLDKRDRTLLSVCVGMVLCMVVLLAVFAPEEGKDDPTPSTYGAGNHGAKAAYLTLGKLGYQVQRWTDPLSRLAERADAHTTLILASPYISNGAESRANIKAILDRGGRVLAAGPSASNLLPHSGDSMIDFGLAKDCDATPIGFDEESVAAHVQIRRTFYWADWQPGDRTQYTCDGKAVVVTYAAGKGEVVWWGDTLPLENAGISKGDNLELLLRSIGPPASTHVYWDESLHGEQASLWSYAQGTPLLLASLQGVFVAMLLLFSYSRRSGPLRADPVVSRASPIEFVLSLGGLFHKAHASNAAVAIAYQQIRRQLQLQFGIPSTIDASAAGLALERRMAAGKEFSADLEQAEAVAQGKVMHEGKALALVQALEQHEQRLRHGFRPHTAKG